MASIGQAVSEKKIFENVNGRTDNDGQKPYHEYTLKKGKQEPKNHHLSQHSPNSHALFATDSLELKLAYTAINEHTNTHKRLILRN